jgi:hypothetical protein
MPSFSQSLARTTRFRSTFFPPELRSLISCSTQVNLVAHPSLLHSHYFLSSPFHPQLQQAAHYSPKTTYTASYSYPAETPQPSRPSCSSQINVYAEGRVGFCFLRSFSHSSRFSTCKGERKNVRAIVVAQQTVYHCCLGADQLLSGPLSTVGWRLPGKASFVVRALCDCAATMVDLSRGWEG